MIHYTSQLQAIADLFRQARYAVAFTGAGISTPSGIPDFRSPDSGLWHNVDPLKVASIYGFRQNPDDFYNWIYPLVQITLEAQPNPAHYALADLENRGILKTIITQNIDMLHTRAGSRSVYELHGHLREATCGHCFTVYEAEPIIRKYLADRVTPHCPRCGGVIKPNVILFGEQLPVRDLMAAKEAAQRSDVMLIVGSSLEVAPASDLPALAKRRGSRVVIINKGPTSFDAQAHAVIHADAAEVLPQIMGRLEGGS